MTSIEIEYSQFLLIYASQFMMKYNLESIQYCKLNYRLAMSNLKSKTYSIYDYPARSPYYIPTNIPVKDRPLPNIQVIIHPCLV